MHIARSASPRSKTKRLVGISSGLSRNSERQEQTHTKLIRGGGQEKFLICLSWVRQRVYKENSHTCTVQLEIGGTGNLEKHFTKGLNYGKKTLAKLGGKHT